MVPPPNDTQKNEADNETENKLIKTSKCGDKSNTKLAKKTSTSFLDQTSKHAMFKAKALSSAKNTKIKLKRSASEPKIQIPTRECKRRIAKDVSAIIRSPLTSEGIYYIHREDNFLEGLAMVIGPKDSLYVHGFYLFEITFPCNYPFEPIKVKFCTGDGKTRLHPNLYVQGKVCLSIINTWRGEGWTSCQTLSSVLLTIRSILDDKPLLNEPGIKETHPDFKRYNRIVEYKNYDTAILRILTGEYCPANFSPFRKYMNQHFAEHKDEIITRIGELYEKYPNKIIISTNMYILRCEIDYGYLFENIKLLAVKQASKID